MTRAALQSAHAQLDAVADCVTLELLPEDTGGAAVVTHQGYTLAYLDPTLTGTDLQQAAAWAVAEVARHRDQAAQIDPDEAIEAARRKASADHARRRGKPASAR